MDLPGLGFFQSNGTIEESINDVCAKGANDALRLRRKMM